MKRRLAGAFARLAILAALAALGARAEAHVDWTQGNVIDEDTIGLYHFDEHDSAAGDVLAVPAGLPQGRGLVIGAPSGVGFATVHDTPEALFDPHSLKMTDAQTAESTNTLHGLDGDLTIELWLKWDSAVTSTSLEVGLRSGAKLRISRDTANPANDQFGISATHGDYADAPGFTSWTDVGTEEAPFDEWIHVAMTVQSTGMHFDSGLGHDVYNAGSTAIFFLNGHAVGADPHTLDVANLRVHDATKIRVRNILGSASVDEVTIWRRDISQGGAAVNPFGDGRGSGTWSRPQWTQTNRPDPDLQGLYQFDSHDTATGDSLAVPAGMPHDRDLLIAAPTSGPGFATAHDTPALIFEPHSLVLDGGQIADSPAAVDNSADDATIEFWLKWDSSVTSQTLEIGYRSSAKIQIARDQFNPANDRFGILATHGDYVSMGGFANWNAIGDDDAPRDEWIHVAATIRSAGWVFDTGLGHEIYLPGSTARFYLNNHLYGTADVAGMRVHPDSRLRIRSVVGGAKVDEVAIWRKDWSEDGAVAQPFPDGRGNGIFSSARKWELYE